MLGRRSCPSTDDLSVQPNSVPEGGAVTESLGQESTGLFDLLRRRLEGFPLDSGCSPELLERLDLARDEGRRNRGWLAGEHERNGVGVLVRDEPPLEQRFDEP